MGRKNLNGAHADLIEKRREMVASMRLQGMSQRRITEALATGYKDKQSGEVLGRMLNPDTNEPFTQKTISEDLAYLKEQWRKNAAESTDDQIAKEEAKIDELEKWAWSKQKGDIVLRCMERRAKLKGLDKPTKIDATSDGQPIQPIINLNYIPPRVVNEDKE